ncbi:hypothetical protein [Dongia rigui]|uniref:Uncharacterized protein n=1 Tax=Dongia rigui TaxID=940149 RepID=A0ABU5DY82_9PROT|nr:hypothetical protein [Dongia rigui]MDY0871516.1 hypothetical protein [Dongia rigui]
MKRAAIYAVTAALLVPLLAPGTVLADSGQLRDPTRCGTGPANCRKLPPTASDTRRNEPRLPSDTRRNDGDKPGLMHTSPLPSEGLQRNPDAPGSTGLDKGSTGITPYPKKKSVGH